MTLPASVSEKTRMSIAKDATVVCPEIGHPHEGEIIIYAVPYFSQ